MSVGQGELQEPDDSAKHLPPSSDGLTDGTKDAEAVVSALNAAKKRKKKKKAAVCRHEPLPPGPRSYLRRPSHRTMEMRQSLQSSHV
jgi:hypothetical protein